MKFVTLLIFLMLTGCGVGEKVCPRNLIPMGCNALVGENIDERLDLLEEAQELLKEKVDGVKEDIGELEDTSDNLRESLDEIADDLKDEIKDKYDEAKKEIDKLEKVVDGLKDGTVEIIDPCGNEGYQDEVLLKLNDDEIIAYFQKGNFRRLITLLENVEYETTDGTRCKFKIVDGKVVEL